MANIRDQDSWVHALWPELATEKAKDLTRMAVARARQLEPLFTQDQSLSHRALVIGGGVAGMTCAANLADQGYDTCLVERETELGGQARRLFSSCKGGDPAVHVAELTQRVLDHPRIQVLTGHEVVASSGFVGNFSSTVASLSDPTQRVIEHGATIVATGGSEFRGEAHGLGTHPRVVTQGDLESQLLNAAKEQPRATHEPGGDGSPDSPGVCLGDVSSVVMLQCVGPWDEPDSSEPFYCSRICCAVAAKNALRIKDVHPDAKVVVLYNRDIRAYGFHESLYGQAREAGVLFLRYDSSAQQPITVADNDPGLRISVRDDVLGERLTLDADLLVLSEAVVPSAGSRELAEMLKFSCTLDGFFLEAHVKLQPVEFPAEGVYLAGMAHYPKLLEETIAQAGAAAARAASILSKDTLEVGGMVAVVDADKCTACLTCVRICPFGAVRVNPDLIGVGEISGAAEITAAACRGCGLCPAECPARAIQLQHFTDVQILAKEDALFEAMDLALAG
jgi:heterodisulfide reductase subunit A-like polyferredoxin